MMRYPSKKVCTFSLSSFLLLSSLSLPPFRPTPLVLAYNYWVITPFLGDAIIDVTVIDEGWMEGRVQRTGAYGMLPSNYVEKQ